MFKMYASRQCHSEGRSMRDAHHKITSRSSSSSLSQVKKRRRELGTLIGDVSSRPSPRIDEVTSPLPSLPASDRPKVNRVDSHRLTSSAQALEGAVVLMSDAYRASVTPRLAAMLTPRWEFIISRVAAYLSDQGGLSLDGYVRWVVRELGRIKQEPAPERVFSLKGVKGWLPRYRRSALNSVPSVMYRQSEVRARQYQERFPTSVIHRPRKE